MMETVTADDGTGIKARVPGFRVAGKTGTAQKVDPVTGGYSADKRVASFVGFVPAEDPRLVVVVMIDEPRGQVYGGLVAAPVFARSRRRPCSTSRSCRTSRCRRARRCRRWRKFSPRPRKSRRRRPSRRPLRRPAALPVVETGPQEIEDVLAAAETPEPAVPAGPQMPDFKGMSYRQVVEVMQNPRDQYQSARPWPGHRPVAVTRCGHSLRGHGLGAAGSAGCRRMPECQGCRGAEHADLPNCWRNCAGQAGVSALPRPR